MLALIDLYQRGDPFKQVNLVLFYLAQSNFESVAVQCKPYQYGFLLNLCERHPVLMYWRMSTMLGGLALCQMVISKFTSYTAHARGVEYLVIRALHVIV